MKILPVGVEFHANGRADGDVTKLRVAFRNFAVLCTWRLRAVYKYASAFCT